MCVVQLCAINSYHENKKWRIVLGGLHSTEHDNIRTVRYSNACYPFLDMTATSPKKRYTSCVFCHVENPDIFRSQTHHDIVDTHSFVDTPTGVALTNPATPPNRHSQVSKHQAAPKTNYSREPPIAQTRVGAARPKCPKFGAPPQRGIIFRP